MRWNKTFQCLILSKNVGSGRVGVAETSNFFSWPKYRRIKPVWLDLENVIKKIRKLFFVIQVLIIAHVPPGLFELYEGMAWFYGDFNKKYLAIMEKYSDVIIAQLYGHEHTDSFRIQFDKEGDVFMPFI